jgi:hypothetical protein
MVGNSKAKWLGHISYLKLREEVKLLGLSLVLLLVAKK